VKHASRPICVLLAMILTPAVMSCANVPRSKTVLTENFELERCCPDRYPARWRVEATAPNGAVYPDVGEAGRGVRLITGGPNQELKLVRALDPREYRGRRLMASVRSRLASQKVAGKAVIRLVASRPGRSPNAWDGAESEPATSTDWSTVSVVQDITDDTTSVELQLVARGDVEAWLDDLVVTSDPAPPRISRRLSSDELAHLGALANLVGYLKFFYPGDQSVQANWRKLEVSAVRKVLASRTSTEVVRALSWLVNLTAPGALLYREGDVAASKTTTPSSRGLHLTRWRHYGYRGGPFGSFREGIDKEDLAMVRIRGSVARGEFEQCQTATLQPDIRIIAGTPNIELLMVPQAGFQAVNRVTGPLAQEMPIRASLTSEVTELNFGLSIQGNGIIEIRSIVLKCENGRKIAELIEMSHHDIDGLGNDLYRVRKIPEDSRMFMRIEKAAASELENKRDELDISIGLNLRLRMPLAVWTNGTITIPESEAPSSQDVVYSYYDLEARIAAAIEVWSAAYWFFPYFDDLPIDWNRQLFSVLQSAAIADTVEAQDAAILDLMAGLHDPHVAVSRYGTDAVLPIFWRIVDKKLLVLNALAPYEKLIPVGSEVLAIDDVPVTTAIKRTATGVSSTESYRDFAIASVLGFGHRGDLVKLRIRPPNASSDTDVVLPRVDGGILSNLREVRSKSGTEVSSNVFYVDLHTLDPETWRNLVSKLENARAIIFDLRGYMTNTAFDVLAHFTRKTISSPRWQVPIVEANRRRKYQESKWTISPRVPAIAARAVFLVDGRSASACETILQIVRDNKLGLIVGERSAGTNGNSVAFETFGRMTIRFTGMRVLSKDGTVTQGIGIEPDVAARPTVAGLIAGRDEVLEAAVRVVGDP
jgi:C-terminal processing protease CtpA/Prc